MEPLLTYDEASTLLNVSKQVLYRMVRNGQLEVITVGAKSRRIHPDEIRRIRAGK